MDAREALEGLLAGGPLARKSVIAAMAGRGFTAKQTRRAREQLGVSMPRSGFGPAMTSVWSLSVPRGSEKAATGTQDGAHENRVSEIAESTVGERRRSVARITFFVARGVGPLMAKRVAASLLERDRTKPTQWGSCAECQRFA
jgi:hypothetical protein